MTRLERRRQRKRQIIRRVCAAILALAFLLSCLLLLTGGGKPEEAIPELVPTAETEAPMPREEREAIDPLAADKEALARMVWGEARGCGTTEQAAVIWCALNRFDSGGPFYADCMTICDIVTQPHQFEGYDPGHPVDPDILALVEDVLARWMAETYCVGDVGRVLPAEFLFFTGDGKENIFTTEWHGGETWDWSLGSPYEE